MKYLYTAYLRYPDDIDQSIRDIYATVSAKWQNKRTFEFLPMIPLWKVKVSDTFERELLESVANIMLRELPDIRLKEFERRLESGYIFIIFDGHGSAELRVLSSQFEEAMFVGDAEHYMPYGFEPHTSLIKQEPSEIEAIFKTLPTDLSKTKFRSKQLIISKETKDGNNSVFEVVYSFTPLPARIGKPAARALHEAGYYSMESVMKLSESELLSFHGVGLKAIDILARERTLI